MLDKLQGSDFKPHLNQNFHIRLDDAQLIVKQIPHLMARISADIAVAMP